VDSFPWCFREQQLEELMEKLEIAGQEREQLARHNALLEKAIIARDRVSADFKEAKSAGGGSYGLEEPKVCCIQSSLSYIVVYEEDKEANLSCARACCWKRRLLPWTGYLQIVPRYGLQSPKCCACDVYSYYLCIKSCDSWEFGLSLEQIHMLWQYDCAQGCQTANASTYLQARTTA